MAEDIIIDEWTNNGNGLGTLISDVWGNGTQKNGTPLVTAPESATDNSVTVKATPPLYPTFVSGDVYGGYAESSSGTATALDNSVTVKDGAEVAGRVFGGYAESSSGTATASGNHVNINNNSISSLNSMNIYGGSADSGGTATASGNFVTITGGMVNGTIYGGSAVSDSGGTATASGNFITITGGTVTGAILGGNVGKRSPTSTDVTATATGNTVTISGSPTIGGQLYGGNDSMGLGGDIFTGNTLNLNSTTTIYNVRNFEIINFGDITNAGINYLDTRPTGAAGSPLVKLNTDGNDITFGGSIVGTGGGIEKIGAGILTLTRTNNTYTGGTTVSEGLINFNAANNFGTTGKITLNGGGLQWATNTVTDISDRLNPLGANGGIFDTNGNDVTFNTALSGDGGLTKTGAGILTLSGNNTYTGLTEVKIGTLALSGSGNISDQLALYGGTTFDTGGAAVNLSQLDVRGNATYNGDLNTTGGTMNFYVPVGAPTGTTMLYVSGDADITDSTVNVHLDGGSTVPQAGEQVVLIDATGGLTGAPTSITSDKWGQGVALQYDFDITTDSSNKQLLATVRATLNPQTKSFSEARLSQLAFGNQGSDLIADQGLSAALDATANRTERRTTTFGAISGGSSRYKTGSHSDVTGLSLITGLAGNSRQSLGKLTLGAFFEYGNANYDSYNSFVNADSVRGKGKTDYTGGGVLAHLEFNPTARGNAWLESSARFGRATVDFQTNDMLGNFGKRTAFDSDSNYAAAHIGTGYHWKLTKQNGLDLYAQYLWSRQNADTVELTTGETVKFGTANSERLRLGTRFVYNLNPNRRAFAGIAWEHEFDGESNASISGFQLDTPKLTGDTCKLELGLTLQPTKTCPITRNFGIQGYTGKREGVAGSIEVRYEF